MCVCLCVLGSARFPRLGGSFTRLSERVYKSAQSLDSDSLGRSKLASLDHVAASFVSIWAPLVVVAVAVAAAAAAMLDMSSACCLSLLPPGQPLCVTLAIRLPTLRWLQSALLHFNVARQLATATSHSPPCPKRPSLPPDIPRPLPVSPCNMSSLAR